MKIIVYEHVSGGGYCENPIPPSFLAEGFAMIRSITADFKAAGHIVTVLLDARLSALNPPINADFIVPILYANEPKQFLSNIAKVNDAVYIIAPETGKELPSMVKLIEETGKVALNCKSEAIAKVTDKAFLCMELEKNGFSVPKTLALKKDADMNQIKHSIFRELTYPLIFKPSDGVGANGLSIIEDEKQIEKALSKINLESAKDDFIVQEFIKGEPASVSVLSNGKKALGISLNRQKVKVSGPDQSSSYEGGIVPFEHSLKDFALALAEKVVESFPGLRGYVGVDIVLAGERAFVLDVNPRLTTSYVGLRKVANFNIAEALINSVVLGKLPLKTEIYGFSCFSKQQTPKPTMVEYQKASKLASIVSPPFPLEGNNESYALSIGSAENIEIACSASEEAKKQLKDIII